MSYSYLLSAEHALARFREAYNVPSDVDIAYCNMGDIDIQRRRGENTVFFPLMAILEGGLRFPVDPLILSTLDFTAFAPTNSLPTFTG